MKILILILVLSLVNEKDLKNKPDKYLNPVYNKMDVLFIKKQDYTTFKSAVGKYSEIVPILIDINKPNGDYFGKDLP